MGVDHINFPSLEIEIVCGSDEVKARIALAIQLIHKAKNESTEGKDYNASMTIDKAKYEALNAMIKSCQLSDRETSLACEYLLVVIFNEFGDYAKKFHAYRYAKSNLYRADMIVPDMYRKYFVRVAKNLVDTYETDESIKKEIRKIF